MQSARGSMPDRIRGNDWLLIKNCSELFLTYQIRLLTFFAVQSNAKLRISISADCKLSDSLTEFISKYSNSICVERRV